MIDPPSGPAVYRDYTQAALDRAYHQRSWAANADAVLAAQAARSADVRSRYAYRASVPYGQHPDQTLDIFPAAAADAPVHIHVHGGGWRHLSKDDVSFLAPAFLAAGITLVLPNFALLPAARMPVLVEHVRAAVGWVARNAPSFGADPHRIHVSGHSSGGHVAGVLTTTDWSDYGLPSEVIKSGLLMSGMYDLEPVLLSARSDYVELSATESAALSPIRHLDRIGASLAIVYGSLESPEFQRQAREYAQAAIGARKDVRLQCIEGANHFEILDGLADPNAALARLATALTQNGLNL